MPKLDLLKITNLSLSDSKAIDILELNVEGISSFADVIVIATASSNRHAKSVSDKRIDQLKEKKAHIIGVEGESDSGWILVDCGNVVINIMKQEQRDFYDLEGLWGKDRSIVDTKNDY